MVDSKGASRKNFKKPNTFYEREKYSGKCLVVLRDHQRF